MTYRFFALILALSAGFTASAERLGRPSFLQFFNGPAGSTVSPVVLNDAGQVAGTWVDAGGVTHGFFRYPDGRFLPFDVSGASITGIRAINSAGAVLGGCRVPAGLDCAFLRHPDGAIAMLSVPGAVSVKPGGLNEPGQVAGTFQDEATAVSLFLREPDGGVTTFAAPDPSAAVVGLTNAGLIVGHYLDRSGNYHGFTVDRTGTVRFIEVPGVFSVRPNAVTPGGLIGGSADSDGFLMDAGGNVERINSPLVAVNEHRELLTHSDRRTQQGEHQIVDMIRLRDGRLVTLQQYGPPFYIPLVFVIAPAMNASTQLTGSYQTGGFVDTPCVVTINPVGRSVDARSQTGSVDVSAPPGCGYMFSSTGGAAEFNPRSGEQTGSRTMSFTAGQNLTREPRRSDLLVGDQTFVVSQAGAPCVFSLVGGTPNFTASGGTGSIAVNGPAGCGWVPQSSAAWLRITSLAAGSSTYGVVNFEVSPNTSGSRAATLTAAGLSYTVSQAGVAGCSYTVGEPAVLPATGGSGTAPLVTSSSCAWTASTNASWLAFPVSSGSGSGSVAFTAGPNPNIMSRTATATIAGQVVSITQQGRALPSGLRFVPVTPCRVADTRTYGPTMAGGASWDFAVAGRCGVPQAAQAFSLNLTVVPSGPLGYLTVWPAGQPQPFVSTLNSDVAVTANAAIVPAGVGGAVSVFASHHTDVIIDVNGYFVVPSGAEGLSFYPTAPCRAVDTRVGEGKTGEFGPPSFGPGGQTRTFPIPTSGCGIPPSAQAYSLNLTDVPGGRVGYVTAFPAGQPVPLASTLNSWDGRVLANAAIVPAGANGAISLFSLLESGAKNDLIVDVNGYFAAPGQPGALGFYPVAPCRVADTRPGQGTTGLFGPPSLPLGDANRDFPIPNGRCGVPSNARAYSLNVTVVPTGRLGYLTVWPSGLLMPLVSTLNSWDGRVLANAAIVPAGTGGGVSLHTLLESGDKVDVIIDINGYFAP